MRGRLRSAGSPKAESTGMTSWEHGVLAWLDPGLKIGLRTRQLSGSAAVRWLRRACAPVRSCGPRRACLRCWLSVRRRGSAVLSFCLDWKREGPVFIEVGGSPKSRHAAASHSCPTGSSVFHCHCFILFISLFIFWHSPQRLFCVGKPKLFQNTLGT